MNTTIRKIGNSEGIIIPKEMLEKYGLKSGDKINLVDTSDGLTIKPSNETFERQMRIARGAMDKYRIALSKLAK